MDDLISRRAAIDALAEQIMESALMDNPTTASTDIDSYRPIAELSLRDVPSAQPTQNNTSNALKTLDCIDRQAVVNSLDALCDRECEYSKQQRNFMCGACRLGSAFDVIDELPSVQPERLTDDDFETIRIHLNAYKENLCNQHRWEEAEEYQRIIDRFMAFASAQPENLVKESCDLVKGLVNDSISRQAAIDAVHKEFDECLVWDESGKHTADEVERVLTDVPSVQPEHTETHSCENQRTETHESRREWYMKGYRDAQRWIPVTERLPKNGHYYLKCTKYGNVDVDYYWDGFENATKYGEEIVAWMEKPKPYRGGQDGTT